MKRQLSQGLFAMVSGVLGAVLVATSSAAATPTPEIVVKNGVTQPVFSLKEAVRETVWVVSDMDSDYDGELDRISARIIRPKETGSGLQVASIVKASPYWTPGTGHTTPWNGWLDEYFVPRGYAVLEVEVAGTGSSDGCMGVGGVEDERSVAAVVHWLNGRATASYADGTPATAPWSTGNVGMYGVSYDASLAIQQAETGIPGLKTIVPVAGTSSEYDQTRAQGIGYAFLSRRYMQGYGVGFSNKKAAVDCYSKYQALGDNESSGDWDFTPIFTERNYRDNVDQVRASVFLVSGQQDDNVKTTHLGRYWEQLVAHNVPRKLYLHSGSHYDPFSPGSALVGRWMDHWLYGLDNGIMAEPQVSVFRVDGTTATENAWPSPDAKATSMHFGPAANGGAGSLTSSPVPGSQQFTNVDDVRELTMVAKPGTPQDYRLAYLSPKLASDQRLSGVGRIEVTFTSATTSTPLTALLVHYNNDGDWDRVVARGSLDAKNRISLVHPTPLVPGQQATGTVLLEPKDYRFPAGSQIGVILTGNLDEFVYPDPEAGEVTVALGASRAVLPLVGAPIWVCTDPAWNATAVYNTDSVVSHSGHRWRAQWWTQSQEPGTTGPWGVWVDLGTC